MYERDVWEDEWVVSLNDGAFGVFKMDGGKTLLKAACYPDQTRPAASKAASTSEVHRSTPLTTSDHFRAASGDIRSTSQQSQDCFHALRSCICRGRKSILVVVRLHRCTSGLLRTSSEVHRCSPSSTVMYFQTASM